MIPWVHLDTAKIPDGQADLKLMRRGQEFSIMSGNIELMNSRLSGSERALATLSCARIEGRKTPRILIGGLGMGFTLRAALEVLPPGAKVVVAELLPAVVAWGRGPMAELFAGCLDDPRVEIREADVALVIDNPGDGYDAILLDVDNGPSGLNREGNDGLYESDGLAAVREALRPRGVAAYWSAHQDPAFARRFRKAGFQVDEVMVRAHRPGKGARHTIWLGAA